MALHPPAREGQGFLTKPELEEAERSLQRECSPVHLDLSCRLQSWENGFVVFEAVWRLALGFSNPWAQRPPCSWVLGRSRLWRERDWQQRRA